MSLLDVLTDKWNYEVVWMEKGVEKHYRCNAESALGAVIKFDANNKVPEIFGVMARSVRG